MIIQRAHLILAITLLLATSAAFIWSLRDNLRLNEEIALRRIAAATSATELKRQVALQSQRVTAAEGKVAALLKAVEAGKKAQAAAPPAPAAAISTQDLVKSVVAHGMELVRAGKFSEALDEYVKCYREVEPKHPGSGECQSLMSSLSYLGRRYPPAMDALGELRDAAMSQHLAYPENRDFVFEIALLNRRLDQGGGTVTLYDSLPPNDSMRQSIAMVGFDAFVEARRYPEALTGKPFGRMLAAIETADRLLASPNTSNPAELRRSVIDATVVNIEVLTGAGRADDARMLTEKLIAFDGSEATRTALRQHLERAGSPPAR